MLRKNAPMHNTLNKKKKQVVTEKNNFQGERMFMESNQRVKQNKYYLRQLTNAIGRLFPDETEWDTHKKITRSSIPLQKRAICIYVVLYISFPFIQIVLTIGKWFDAML